MFVGDTFTLVTHHQKWWGEGDEKIYVDGEKFPSHFGTGTEPELFMSLLLRPCVRPDGGVVRANSILNVSHTRLRSNSPFSLPSTLTRTLVTGPHE